MRAQRAYFGRMNRIIRFETRMEARRFARIRSTSGIPSMIQSIGLDYGPIGGHLFDVAQGLPGEFRDHGVGMAKQENQQADRAEFSGIDADHGDCVCHLVEPLSFLFGRRREFLNCLEFSWWQDDMN